MDRKESFTHREIWKMIILIIVTLGIYTLYWVVKTKNELNQNGADIPTAWLIIVPFANVYFLYRFAQEYSTILHNNNNVVAYFLLLLLVPFIGILVLQSEINKNHPVL